MKVSGKAARALSIGVLAALGMQLALAQGPERRGRAVRAQELAQPGCPDLQAWAQKYAPRETMTLAPKVKISALFRDELVVPLFGKPVSAWSSTDANGVKRQLDQCRRVAGKRKDKQASARLYDALKAIGASTVPLTQMHRARSAVPRQVQWLVDAPPSEQLQGQLALAQDALRGEAINPGNYGIRRRPDWISTLQQAPDYLPASEIEPLVTRLAQRREALEAESRAAADELATARNAIASTPATPQGLASLARLAQLPALAKVPRSEADAFRAAVQNRTRAIQVALQQQQARQAAVTAATPVNVEARLAELLIGDEVSGVSIRGLRPGVAYQEAAAVMKRDWGFGSGAGSFLMKDFSPNRRDLNRYATTLRRDGGRFEYETMHGRVGQIKFAENYTGPINVRAVYAWLEQRFGEPEKHQTTGAAFLARWHDDDAYLQAYAANQATGPRSTKTFRSSVVLTLWSREYMTYLAKATKKCAELRSKPMGELSIDDRQALVMGCKSP